jgi:LPXTG-site transpeptidase (sortase) family protein
MDYDRLSPRNQRYSYDDYVREGTGKRRFLTAFALLWVFVGLALLGAAGYMFVYRPAAEDQWVWVRPGGGSVAVAGAEDAPNSPLGAQPFRLVISKLGIDAPVGAFGLDENAVPEVPFEKDLVAWYTFSAYPGTGENAVFAGHYTWNGDAVFRHLGDLEAGDGVVVRGENGLELVYRVSEKTVISQDDAAGREWMKPVGADVVTLITCGGEHYETDDELGGGYTHRQVVRAELITVTQG